MLVGGVAQEIALHHHLCVAQEGEIGELFGGEIEATELTFKLLAMGRDVEHEVKFGHAVVRDERRDFGRDAEFVPMILVECHECV